MSVFDPLHLEGVHSPLLGLGILRIVFGNFFLAVRLIEVLVAPGTSIVLF